MEVDVILFEKLRAVRNKLAKEHRVPKYDVFTNSTLADIANLLPISRESFRNISGIGEYKLEKYCREFAEVIVDHLASRDKNPPSHWPVEPRDEEHEEFASMAGRALSEGQRLRILENFSAGKSWRQKRSRARGAVQDWIDVIRNAPDEDVGALREALKSLD